MSVSRKGVWGGLKFPKESRGNMTLHVGYWFFPKNWDPGAQLQGGRFVLWWLEASLWCCESSSECHCSPGPTGLGSWGPLERVMEGKSKGLGQKEDWCGAIQVNLAMHDGSREERMSNTVTGDNCLHYHRQSWPLFTRTVFIWVISLEEQLLRLQNASLPF